MGKFDELIALLEPLENDSYGDWTFDKTHKGTLEDPMHMPFIEYTEIVHSLIQAVYRFSENNPDYELREYTKLLKDRGLEWNHSVLESADVSNMDAQGVMAILMGLIRGERFCDGVILASLKKGIVQKWLRRLKEISESE